MRSKSTFLFIFNAIFLFTSSCSFLGDQKSITHQEQTLIEIPLKGPITKKKVEISGLTWMDETLILLPQHPEKLEDPGVLFTLPKQSIVDFLDGKSVDAITPGVINIFMSGLEEKILHFEGFESITVKDDNVYLTIESGKGHQMKGYLITGKISADQTEIHLDLSKMVPIQPPIQLDNRTDEALIYYQDQIYTFFEVNGSKINPNAIAHVFDLGLNAVKTVDFPNLEYRVTDAAIEEDGGVWVINQASLKDIDILPPSTLTVGLTDRSSLVEQLVKLNINENGFALSNVPPIQIELEDNARNWEGLALLDGRGFLLVTDKSPDTILAFLQMP